MSKYESRDFSRNIKVGEYTFQVREAQDWAYCNALKDGMNPCLILFIHAVDEKGTVVAEYERVWEGHLNSAHAYAFINKFLQDSKYRQQYQTHGDPIIAELPKSKDLVNPLCAKAIQRVNASKSEKLKFRDFAALKTYGRDKVSSMKMDVLKDIVSEEEMERIKGAVDERDVIAVLRWMKRGLHMDHAIHKVKVDREIANNTR